VKSLSPPAQDPLYARVFHAIPQKRCANAAVQDAEVRLDAIFLMVNPYLGGAFYESVSSMKQSRCRKPDNALR
jgi:hypothetical protein